MHSMEPLSRIILQGVDVMGIKTVIVYGLPDTVSQMYQVCVSVVCL